MSVETQIPTLPKLTTRKADISWVAYHPIDLKIPSTFTPEEETSATQFWTTTVLSLDNALQDEKNEETNKFLTRFGEEMKVYYNRKRAELLENVTNYLIANSEAIYLSMASGSLPDMMDVWIRADSPDAHARMHSIIVGGSDGAEIKKTILKSKLPDVGTSDTPTVIGDDVADTEAAIAVTLEEIEAQREKRQADSKLSERLAGSFGKPYEDYTDHYLELAQRLHTQNILLAINVYKNRPFFTALYSYCQELLRISPDNIWALKQLTFLHLAVHKPAKQWVMGMDMDSGIKGKDIIKHLDKDLLVNTITRQLIDHLASHMLRIGSTVDTLIALQERGDKHAIGELIAWAGKEINRKLRNIADA